MKVNFIKLYILFLILILLICLLAGCPSQVGSSGGGGVDNSPKNIKLVVDSNIHFGQSTSIAIDGLNVYISYCDMLNGNLKFAKSSDGGVTWPASNIKGVDPNLNVGLYNSIAVEGSNIYISYYDEANKDLKFAKSTDGGNTWPVLNMRIIDSIGDVGEYTSLAINGSEIYISYYDSTNKDLKFARSTDYGNTWLFTNLKTVDFTGDVGTYTSIAVDGLNIYISYYDITNGDLKLAKSTDGGALFPVLNIRTIDTGGGGGNVGEYSSIAVDGSNIYISYSSTNHLKFAKSTDGGYTWPASNIQIADVSVSAVMGTSIAVNGSNLYISYYDWASENLKFVKSTSGGYSWLTDHKRNIDSIENMCDTNSIAADGTNVYVSYFDRNDDSLKFAKSIDKGDTWAP